MIVALIHVFLIVIAAFGVGCAVTGVVRRSPALLVAACCVAFGAAGFAVSAVALS